VLDLACGDANMAEPLLELGFAYRGVDGSAEMIAEARRRLGDAVPLEVALLDEYEPAEPVDMTLCLRAFYYPADRRAFFRLVAGYTRTKFVFDFDPRVYEHRELLADLRAGGFDRVDLRPFFLPQRVAVPWPFRAALTALEHGGPLARAALRVRGIWFCAATPSPSSARS
jgi:SAM-dependent methyltransferase